MEKYLILAAILIGSAVVVPGMLEQTLEERADQGQEQLTQVSARQQQGQSPQKEASFNPLDGRRAVIKADNRGHFVVEARMNGYRTEVLVDTGATLVAINESTARDMGIRLKESDFKYQVRTANGIAKAASATIDEIEIGRVRVKNVRASVSKDGALSTTLLGMSFLNELKRFEVQGNELVLMQ